MRDQRWQRIEELYHAALDRHPSKRAAFLQAECAGDDTLLRDVESLLAEGDAEQFLATPAIEVLGREMAASRDMLIGRDIGPYQIQSLLGAGGMGEVYRARDTKLHRDVAIKVLPSAVAYDPSRLTRFTREARLLAALNHPHIAAIHGVEDADGISALVLELVDGETLSERIARGPLKTADAIAIARQIVDGLESAHEHGIVHRDLKPSNIKRRSDGNVKILDFGLAKALAPADLSRTPNRTSVTQAGVVIGTPAYMSPEQAQGQAVDERTDIWAFGCVLYEMLTGRQAFAGQSMTETLAAVIAAEPSWDALPHDLSPTLRVFLKRCLAKDPRQRISDVRTLRLALDGAFETDSPLKAPPVGGDRQIERPLWPLPWLGGLLLGAGVIAGTWALSQPPREAQPLVRSFVATPEQLGSIISVVRDLTMSPDGSRVVYGSSTLTRPLGVRSLDQLESSVLPGTEGASSPVFSPDGGSIVFFDQRQSALKRIALLGGQASTIGSTDGLLTGLSWGPDDTIVFATETSAGLVRMSADGRGKPEQLTTLANGEVGHRWPAVLPNGRGVLFTSWRGSPCWLRLHRSRFNRHTRGDRTDSRRKPSDLRPDGAYRLRDGRRLACCRVRSHAARADRQHTRDCRGQCANPDERSGAVRRGEQWIARVCPRAFRGRPPTPG